MTITTINISGTDYTSYASVAEADSWLAVDPNRSAAWAALVTTDKEINLVAATNRLDLVSWSGTKENPAQANQWHSAIITDPDHHLIGVAMKVDPNIS